MISKAFVKTILKVIKQGNEASTIELAFVPEINPNEVTDLGILVSEMIKALIVKEINEKDFVVDFVKIKVYKKEDDSIEDFAELIRVKYTYKQIFEHLNQNVLVDNYATYSLCDLFFQEYLRNYEAENIINVKTIGAITKKTDRQLLANGTVILLNNTK